MKNWKNAYPINTFTGKTQMELIGFIESLLKANDDAWREKIEKAMGKDEQETFNHTYTTLSGGISNIRVEAFTRNCFRKHIKKSLKEKTNE